MTTTMRLNRTITLRVIVGGTDIAPATAVHLHDSTPVSAYPVKYSHIARQTHAFTWWHRRLPNL